MFANFLNDLTITYYKIVEMCPAPEKIAIVAFILIIVGIIFTIKTCKWLMVTYIYMKLGKTVSPNANFEELKKYLTKN